MRGKERDDHIETEGQETGRQRRTYRDREGQTEGQTDKGRGKGKDKDRKGDGGVGGGGGHVRVTSRCVTYLLISRQTPKPTLIPAVTQIILWKPAANPGVEFNLTILVRALVAKLVYIFSCNFVPSNVHELACNWKNVL